MFSLTLFRRHMSLVVSLLGCFSQCHWFVSTRVIPTYMTRHLKHPGMASIFLSFISLFPPSSSLSSCLMLNWALLLDSVGSFVLFGPDWALFPFPFSPPLLSFLLPKPSFFSLLFFSLLPFFSLLLFFISSVGFSFHSLLFSFLKARLGFFFLFLLAFPSPVLFSSPFFYKPSWDFSWF